MKLHLPHKLRNSLMACICSVAAIGSTLGTATLIGSALLATTGQAQAAGEDTSSYETAFGAADKNVASAGKTYNLSAMNNSAGYDGNVFLEIDPEVEDGYHGLYVAADGTISIDKIDHWCASNHDAHNNQVNYTKLGAGTLVIEDASSFNYPNNATVSAGTLQIGFGSQNGFVSGNVSVAAGATLNLAHTNALGWGDNATKTLTLTGAENNLATLSLTTNTNQTLKTNLVLEGNTSITAEINNDTYIKAYGGTITANGSNNTINAWIRSDVDDSKALTLNGTGSLSIAKLSNKEGLTVNVDTTIGAYTGAGTISVADEKTLTITDTSEYLAYNDTTEKDWDTGEWSGNSEVHSKGTNTWNLLTASTSAGQIVIGQKGVYAVIGGNQADNFSTENKARTIKGNYLIHGDLYFNRNGEETTSYIGDTGKLEVTGDAIFSTKQTWTVEAGGSLTVGGTIGLGHRTEGAYWGRLNVAGDVVAGGVRFYNNNGSANNYLKMTGGSLSLGTGGITTYDNRAAKIQLEGGTLKTQNANGWTSEADVDVYLGKSGGGSTLTIAASNAGTITFAGETTFLSTITNEGKLSLTGTLLVDNLADLDSKHIFSDGVSGFETDTYCLVKGQSTTAEDGTTITPVLTLPSAGASVTVEGSGSDAVYVENGGAYFARTDTSTYYVNAGGSDVTYAAQKLIVGSNVAVNVKSYTLNGGTLVTSEAIATEIKTAKDSIIAYSGVATDAVTRREGKHLSLVGGTAAEDKVLVLSGAVSADALTTYGDVVLAGDANVGEKAGNITVSTGSTLQYGDDAAATNALGAGTITVQSGGTFAVHHAASNGHDTYLTGDANVTLQGGTFSVLGMGGTGALRYGTLKVEGDGAITSAAAHTSFFDVLTGEGNLSVGAYGVEVEGNTRNLTGDTYVQIGFDKVSGYSGTITVAEDADTKLYINTIEDGNFTVTGQTYSRASKTVGTSGEPGFTMSAGTVSLDQHTAEGAFRVNGGSMTVESMTLESGASLELNAGSLSLGSIAATGEGTRELKLHGGTFSAKNAGGFSTAGTGVVTRLGGAVTLGGSYSITLENVTFDGAVENNAALTLGGTITVAPEALTHLEPVSGANVTYSNGTNGFLSGSYTLISGTGAITLAGGYTLIGAESLTVSEGGKSATIVVQGTGGTYYINSAATYAGEVKGEDAVGIEDATGIYVTSGNSLTYGNAAHATQALELESAGLVMTGGNIGTEGTNVGITVLGTGENASTISNSDGSSSMYATVSGTGDLMLSGPIVVQSGSTFGNDGVVSLGSGVQAGYGSFLADKVASIQLAGGTLSVAGGQDVTHALSTTAASTVIASGTGASIRSFISGDGDLTVQVEDGAQLGFYGNAAELNAGLTFSGGATQSGVVNLGHKDGQGNPNLSHAGDLVIDGVQATLNRDHDFQDPTMIANGGNLEIKNGGSLSVDAAESSDGGSSIALAGGKILIGNGTLTVGAGAGDISAKSLEMTEAGSSLVLGKGITLTGGAEGTAPLVLTGGTVKANADVALGYNATLGNVTFASEGDCTLTLGAAGTTTTFTQAVTNTGNLALAGSIMVDDFSGFNLVEGAASSTRGAGENGFVGGTYTLVTGGNGASLALADGMTVQVKGYADAYYSKDGQANTFVSAGGGATIFTHETTYHVAAGEVSYSTIANAKIGDKAVDFETISMEGGRLNVAAGEGVDEQLVVSAATTISGGASSALRGGITMAEGATGDLTIYSSSTDKGHASSHGASFHINSKDSAVNLGANNLIIASGVVNIGTGGDNLSVQNFTAGAIEVQKDAAGKAATLKLGMDTSSTLNTDIILNGGEIIVQATDSKHGDPTLNIGTLTLQQNGSISAYNTSNLTFEKLTGSSDLALSGGSLTTNFSTVENYTGKLSLSSGNANVNGGTLGGEVSVSGGQLTVASGASISGDKAVSVSGGTLRLNGASNLAADKAVSVSNGGVLLAAAEGATTTLNNVTLNGGEVQVGHGTLAGQVTLAGGDNTIKCAHSEGSEYAATTTGKGNLAIAAGGKSEEVNRILKISGSIENTGDVTVTSGKVSLEGTATLANKAANGTTPGDVKVSGGELTIQSGATVSSTVKAMDGTTTVASISGKGTQGATYAGVKVTTSGLSGGTLSGAEVTISKNFALTGISASDCEFNLNAALRLDEGSTLDNSTLNIGTEGSVVGGSLSGKHSLTVGSTNSELMGLQSDVITGLLNLKGSEETTYNLSVVTTNQLAQLDSLGETSLALNMGGSLAELVSGMDTSVLLIFTLPAVAQEANLGGNDSGVGSSLSFTLSQNLEGYGFRLGDAEDVSAAFALLNQNNVSVSLPENYVAVYIQSHAEAVPEPTTATLSLLALAALAARRRRR